MLARLDPAIAVLGRCAAGSGTVPQGALNFGFLYRRLRLVEWLGGDPAALPLRDSAY
jgi:hypothetical protein